MLRTRDWLGLTMWPGYVDTYYSPVEIIEVVPLKHGNGRMDLTFFNLAYAKGVAVMTYKLRVLRREASYFLAAVEDSDRTICLELLTPRWMKHHFPGHYNPRLFSDDQQPISTDTNRLERFSIILDHIRTM